MESLFFLPLLSLSLSLSRLLIDSSFVTVPPSLLACACLSEAVSFVVPTQHRKCVERLSRLTGVEQVRSCNTWHCHWRPLPCPYVLLWRPLTKFLCNTCRYILYTRAAIFTFSLFSSLTIAGCAIATPEECVWCHWTEDPIDVLSGGGVSHTHWHCWHWKSRILWLFNNILMVQT